MFVDWLKVAFIGGFLFILTVCASHAAAPLTREALIELNTAPVGVVDVGGPVAAVAAVARTGQQVYEAACSTCHAQGLAGAPSIKVKAAWVPRIAEGEDTLVKHAIGGYKSMPAKGGCSSCSDDEVKSAVEYILSQVK
jgi:cytochrome c5